MTDNGTASGLPANRARRPHAAAAAARVQELVDAAATAAADDTATPAERAEMLMELAMGLQLRPKTPDHLHAAVELYERAIALCPAEQALLAARIMARKGTALQAVPDAGVERLEGARQALEQAIPVLESLGVSEELAEAEMNLGLALQQLAAAGRTRIGDAIAAYQRALRAFEPKRFPAEFAVLQNNLATAFLSLPFTDQRGRMREALAVQCFEEALRAVTLIDHPVEYAMLQNNLGNALQHASSSRATENRLRAVAAYDEALKVRTRRHAPLEYANTIANKATCLSRLPDDPERADDPNLSNLRRARDYYEEAREIFRAHGEIERERILGEAIAEIDGELGNERKNA
jgi:tetratricopeptide (TPR) repeat protein